MSTKSLTRTSDYFPSLFDDFSRPWSDWFNQNRLWERTVTIPSVNISENKNAYEISLAAPGLKKNDFNINVEGNMITVSCEKEETKEEKENNHTRKEYNYSSFSRSFTLPDEVRQDQIEASYDDGILKIKLPKKEEAKKAVLSKQISVK